MHIFQNYGFIFSIYMNMSHTVNNLYIAVYIYICVCVHIYACIFVYVCILVYIFDGIVQRNSVKLCSVIDEFFQ